jgi:hypothetical protein
MKNPRQKTIGTNPLEHYFSYTREQAQEEIAENIQPAATHTTMPQKLAESPALYDDNKLIKKQRVTIHAPEDLIDRVKNVVYWEPGLTLAGFAEYALECAVDKMEQERGTPFPDRKTRKLRGGRPIK